MDNRQFNVLADLARLKKGSKARQGAELVMVQGVTQVQAAKQAGCTQPSVSAAVRRVQNVHRLALRATQ
jgi:ABC-type Fe3+ transport system substrate-binding protein